MGKPTAPRAPVWGCRFASRRATQAGARSSASDGVRRLAVGVIGVAPKATADDRFPREGYQENRETFTGW